MYAMQFVLPDPQFALLVFKLPQNTPAKFPHASCITDFLLRAMWSSPCQQETYSTQTSKKCS